MPLEIFFNTPGTYTIDDDGVRGNNTSVVRDSTGAVLFPFLHPGDVMKFTPTVAGVNFVFNTADSFGSADVTAGSLAGQSPDSIVVRALRTGGTATLVSSGAITEGGSDAAADLVAAATVLSAVSGIGAASNALEIETTFIEAETSTGGINLANYGQVQIGGLTADVAGLDVANSGNISFSTVGSIFLSDTTGGSTVHGGNLSGNVTLNAIGAAADIYAPIDQPAIYAPGGGITLNAGRDVLLGIGGTNYDNDVLATGDIVINAGNDFVLDGTSNIATGAFGGVVGGNIAITTGGDISMTDTTGGLQTIEAFNGDVTLTTGPGGTFLQNGFFSAAVQTTNDITVNADNVLLLRGGLNTTGIGQVATRPVTAGRAIDVGTAVDPFGAVGLSPAEIDRVFSLNLALGDADTGPVEFSAALAPTILANMDVRSGTEIFMRAMVTLAGSLALRAGDDLHVSSTGGFTSTATSGASFTAFVDSAQDDGGAGGLGVLGGTFSVPTPLQLTGNADRDTLTGSGGNDILNGRGGADTLAGLAGDDWYHVDNVLDAVTEGAAEGANDRILASVSYALGAGVHVERLTTDNNAGTAAINLSGNSLADLIYGNAGANVLDGRGGADTLVGLGGDDFFVVDNLGDVVVEGAGEGANDRVLAGVSYTLGAGVQVERLTTTDNNATTAINLTGNAFANVIYGNAGANVLNGASGIDTLIGLGGDDFLYVDNAGDTVIEGAGEGANDRVLASVSYVLGAGVHVERLTTSDNNATTAISLTGNELVNVIYGNAGANVLDGRGGSDTLIGMIGADTFRFTTAPGAGNVDSISDYNVAADTIQLENAVFAGLAAGALAAGAFNTGAAATQADDRIVYNSATGALLFDVDGLGGAAAVQFAALSTGLALTAGDFFVI